MSDAKHTPGPWSAAYFYSALRHIERNVDRDAYLSDEDAKEIDEGRLNAPDVRYNPADVALIAAAPDLLALLEELIDIEGPQPGHVVWANKVKAAIKKARGE